MMNPNMINGIKQIMSMGDPRAAVISMLESNAKGNPMMLNLLQLAKNGNGAEIEQIARNMMREQGKDFDSEFKKFKDSFKL